MKKNEKLYKIVFTGLFTAISFALYMLEIPFSLGTSALKFDFSDIPALIGGLYFGPVFGIVTELLKNLFGLLVRGLGEQMGFGNLMNAIVGISFVVPFSLIYKKLKEKLGMPKTLTLAGVVSSCSMLIGGALGNLVIAPLFFKFFLNLNITWQMLTAFLASAEILNAIKAVMLCAVSVPIACLLLPKLKNTAKRV